MVDSGPAAEVLAKTCKLVPVMMMGSVLNKTRYTFMDYAQGWVMVLAMSAMVSVQRPRPTPF